MQPWLAGAVLLSFVATLHVFWQIGQGDRSWQLAGLLLAALSLLLLGGLLWRHHQLSQERDALLRQNVERTEALVTARHELNARQGYISTLAELSRFLQACGNIQEMARILQHIAPRLFAEPSGALYLFAESGEQLERAAQWGQTELPEQLPAEATWAGRQSDMPQSLCLPLRAQGELIGALYLQQSQLLPRFDLQMAEMAAEQIAVGVANMRLRERLAAQAVRDPQTGLCNRRHFEELLGRELQRANRRRRNGQPVNLAVVMLEIVDFKPLQEKLGATSSDRLLRDLARLLCRQVRTTDIVARLEPQRFALALPEADVAIACQRMEAARTAALALPSGLAGTSSVRLQLAFCAVDFPTHGETIEALLDAVEDGLNSQSDEHPDRPLRRAGDGQR